ncbi:hypothetical protein BJ085DRAFT_40656 [Dimargaris cristalligena]|uniref:Uncharacterized protein n=1 Tax=Dimargaris cristalligena TaxID=215637 RepID=A0A4P9ZRL4_9FUNG|nr:hypothetical protein BJ085DRAFT_40656 [Dimargaris cristalligena]|eukprot:RKP36047.1 hypothetical protein BJ085DRAFT_40656 [Dimargaris cristalligena]
MVTSQLASPKGQNKSVRLALQVPGQLFRSRPATLLRGQHTWASRSRAPGNQPGPAPVALPFGVYMESSRKPTPVTHPPLDFHLAPPVYPAQAPALWQELFAHNWLMDRVAPQRIPLTASEARFYKRQRAAIPTAPTPADCVLPTLLNDTSPLWPALSLGPTPRPRTLPLISSDRELFRRRENLDQVTNYGRYLEDPYYRSLRFFNKSDFLGNLCTWSPMAPWFNELFVYTLTQAIRHQDIWTFNVLADHLRALVAKGPRDRLPKLIPSCKALLKHLASQKDVGPFQDFLNQMLNAGFRVDECTLSHLLLLLVRAQLYPAVVHFLHGLDPCGPKPSIAAINSWLQTILLQTPSHQHIGALCQVLIERYPPRDFSGQFLPDRYQINGATLGILLQACNTRNQIRSVWLLICQLRVLRPSNALLDSPACQRELLRACVRAEGSFNGSLASNFMETAQCRQIRPNLFNATSSKQVPAVLAALLSPSAQSQVEATGVLASWRPSPSLQLDFLRARRTFLTWAEIKQIKAQLTLTQPRLDLGIIAGLWVAIIHDYKITQTRILRRSTREAQRREAIWRETLQRPSLNVTTPSFSTLFKQRRSDFMQKFVYTAQLRRTKQSRDHPTVTTIHSQLALRGALVTQLWKLGLQLAVRLHSPFANPTPAARQATSSASWAHFGEMIEALSIVSDTPARPARKPVAQASTVPNPTMAPLPMYFILTYIRSLGALGAPQWLEGFTNELSSHLDDSTRTGWWSNAPVFKPRVFRCILVAAWTSTRGRDLDLVWRIFQQLYQFYSDHHKQTSPSSAYSGGMTDPVHSGQLDRPAAWLVGLAARTTDSHLSLATVHKTVTWLLQAGITFDPEELNGLLVRIGNQIYNSHSITPSSGHLNGPRDDLPSTPDAVLQWAHTIVYLMAELNTPAQFEDMCRNLESASLK